MLGNPIFLLFFRGAGVDALSPLLDPCMSEGSHLYGGCSKSSDLYLVALSRDIYERHMHVSKELVFTSIMMLIFSHCNVLFNNCSTLYMAHSWSIPLVRFHVIEL